MRSLSPHQAPRVEGAWARGVRVEALVMPVDEGKLRTALAEVFAKFDEDSSGSISSDELGKISRDECPSRRPKFRCNFDNYPPGDETTINAKEAAPLLPSDSNQHRVRPRPGPVLGYIVVR